MPKASRPHFLWKCARKCLVNERGDGGNGIVSVNRDLLRAIWPSAKGLSTGTCRPKNEPWLAALGYCGGNRCSTPLEMEWRSGVRRSRYGKGQKEISGAQPDWSANLILASMPPILILLTANWRFRPRNRGGQSPPRASHRPSSPLLTRTFTATRRFCALPWAVSLSANGSASDIPVGVSMR